MTPLFVQGQRAAFMVPYVVEGGGTVSQNSTLRVLLPSFVLDVDDTVGEPRMTTELDDGIREGNGSTTIAPHG